MVINLAAWTNLSLSVFFLSAIYLFIKTHSLDSESKKIYLYLSLLVGLIILASLTHLYYLPMLVFFLGPGFALMFFQRQKKKSLLGMAGLLSSVISVYAVIRITDGHYNIRPTETLGFNSEGWTCSLGDYFKSYNFLDLPALKEQSDWNLERLTFLGSGFPLLIVLVLVTFFLVRRQGISFNASKPGAQLIWGILAGTLICYFTSIGNQLNLFVGKIQVFNFLNPLTILAKLSDSAEHFRCMSRFSLPVFTGVSLLGFYFLDRVVKLPFGEWKKWLIVGMLLLVSLFDVFQMMHFTSKDFTADNHFSEENLESIPVINDEFDAILPIPYFNVGSEKLGYIIDDNDQWSRFVFQFSLKNKKPIMASKMSRTPVVHSEKLLSLFQETTDAELLELLKGKKILICESTEYKAPSMKDEPAMTIASSPKIFIDKWQPQFKGEANGINYYLLEF